MAPRGYNSFTLGCGGGSINSVKRSRTLLSYLLRLTEFILPPQHPSGKELYPLGAISYDQIQLYNQRIYKSIISFTTNCIHFTLFIIRHYFLSFYIIIYPFVLCEVVVYYST